jgi:hypothetical protein
MSNIDLDCKIFGDGGRGRIMLYKNQVFFGGFFGSSLCKKAALKKGVPLKKQYFGRTNGQDLLPY